MQNSNTVTKRRALGRGLSTLIPIDSEEKGSENEIVMVDINAIKENPFQPRTEFNEEEIKGLAESIKVQGLLQPLLLRKKGDFYEIISGERRFRALKLLGYDKVASIVRAKVTDREMLEVALVENVQRENLDEIELAHAYQKLLLECGLSHEQLSERIGKSRSAITNILRLLKLPTEVQDAVHKRAITAGHARALVSLESEQEQIQLCNRIIRENLSVREVENICQGRESNSDKLQKIQRKKKLHSIDEPEIKNIIEQLQYRFGTQIKVVTTSKGKGVIEIDFYSHEDLNRILDLLLTKQPQNG